MKWVVCLLLALIMISAGNLDNWPNKINQKQQSEIINENTD